MSEQDVEEASQNITCPGETDMLPAFTVAVSVISEPEATDPSGGIALPLDVIVSVVVVEAGAAQAEDAPMQTAMARSAGRNNREEFLTFKTISRFVR